MSYFETFYVQFVLTSSCQLFATGQWFSPVSPSNKTDRHDITEILLKVALNTIKPQKKKFTSSCLQEGSYLIYLQLFVGELMSYLRYLFLFTYCGV